MADVIPKPGRPPNRQVYQSEIRAAERTFADKLPQAAEAMLELAMGKRPERCLEHREVLECPTCHAQSVGSPINQSALQYVLNRIMGTPTVAGEQRINSEFAQRMAKHVAEVFNAVNDLPTPEERREQFAMRMAEMWMALGG